MEGDRVRLTGDEIPRIFHRVWLDEPIPPKFEAFWEKFRDLHPGWAFFTWNRTEDLLGWLRCREVFEWQTTWAGKSDVVRYEVLRKFGGIYVDTDVEPLRSFEPLLDSQPFAGFEDARLICPTVMGSPPEHPAIEDLVARLPGYARVYRNRPPNVQTGPRFLTRRWRRRLDVTLYAPIRFYPVHWTERHLLGGPYPEESFSVHHWNQGWDPDAKARIDARASVLR